MWLAQPSFLGSVSLVQFDEGSQEEAKLPATTGQYTAVVFQWQQDKTEEDIPCMLCAITIPQL